MSATSDNLQSRLPLFVYGTLMDPGKQRELLGCEKTMQPATLNSYERRFGEWPYLMPNAAGKVEGMLMTDLTADELKRLDDYEEITPTMRHGRMRQFYFREPAQVLTETNHLVTCWVYQANLPDWTEDQLRRR